MSAKYKYYLLTGIYFLFVSANVFANNNISLPVVNFQQYRFDKLTSEDGLSNNFVTCIQQDKLGYLWFGTYDGLNIFDGYEIKTFKNKSVEIKGLTSNTVFKIIEDPKGNMWLSTNDGIFLYKRETLKFEIIPFYSSRVGISRFYDTYNPNLIIDKKGNLITATTVGVFIYDSVKKEMNPLFNNEFEVNLDNLEGIRDILIDKKNRLWIGTMAFGLYGVDLNNNKLVAGSKKKDNIYINNKVNTIAEDRNGDIWVGTDAGIYVIDTGLKIKNIYKSTNKPGSLSINNILRIYIDKKDRIWIGTDGGGLNLFNPTNGKFSCFKSNPFNKYSINNNYVNRIFVDNQDVLWVGTQQGGLNYTLLNNFKQFEHFYNETGNPNSLRYNTVSCIYEDSDGDLWIGTDGGGLDFIEHKTGKYKHFENGTKSANSLSSNSVLVITEDNQGNIWLGGYLMGVNVLNKKTGAITKFHHDPGNPGSLNNDDVRDIYIDKNENIWVVSNGGGLNKFNPETKTFTHFMQGGSSSSNSIWCLKIIEDSYGDLFIGTYYGFSILNTKTNTFRNFIQDSIPGGLSDNWIYAFAEDSLKNMWIGTANGLNYYDRKNEDFVVFTEADGLPNNVINGLLLDDKNNLWISTNKGLSKYNPYEKNSKFVNFDLSDGLQGNQFFHGSYFKGKSGKMYFGGYNGFNSFYPDSIKENDYIPPVYITDFLIFYKKVSPFDKDSPLKKPVSETKEIKLRYDQSVITFRFSALNFINPYKNQYAYKMEGFDQKWNDIGTRREVTFTNLDPGTYTLRVIASNNDGKWNEQGTSLKVIILPPWWKTLLFKVVIAILILSVITGSYFYRIRAIKDKNRELEALVKKRTHEITHKNELLLQQANELNETNFLLEERQKRIEDQTEELSMQNEKLLDAYNKVKELSDMKDKFFSVIGHDLKNPINIIMGYSSLLESEMNGLSDDQRQFYVKNISIAARNTYNLLENLLDWARSQSGKHKITPESIFINSLFQNNLNLFKDQIKEKKIELKLDIDPNLVLYADLYMIETVVRNLINNAVKFSNSGGKIAITGKLYKNSGFIEIIVSDSGVGIAKENLNNLFKIDSTFTTEGTSGEKGTGLGLILCSEFVEKNGGKIWAESAEGKGSSFHFTIPRA